MTFGPRNLDTEERSALPHWVYVLLDADDKPVYIGCSSRPGNRLATWQNADWWPQVARIDVTVHADQRAALDVERSLIEQYDPPQNTVHTARYNAGGWDTRRRRCDETGEPIGGVRYPRAAS